MAFNSNLSKIIRFTLIFGLLSEFTGILIRYLSLTFYFPILLLGYILLVLGLLGFSIQILFLWLGEKSSTKALCIFTMIASLGFYLLTPITSLLFRNFGLPYLFLIPAVLSFIMALGSISFGLLFLKKRE